MGYRGMTVDIPLGLGGLDGNANNYQVDPKNLAEALNVIYRSDSIAKAKGLAALDATGVGATAICLGGHDWRPTSSLQYQVTAWDDGAIYRESSSNLDATTLVSGLSFTNPVHFITGGHLSLGGSRSLYAFSKNVQPQQVAGSGTSMGALTANSADWDPQFPGAAIYHDARIYAFDLDNAPHTYYVSALLDHGDFSIANGGRVRSVFPGEGEKISAMVSFGGTTLYAFKRPYGVYRIDTTNVTSYQMPAERVRGDVGAAGANAVIKVGADVYFVSPNGRLYSLASLTPERDVKDADITAGLNLETYIDENFDKTRSEWVRLTYNERTKELYYYFTSFASENDVNDRCLVFNLETPGVVKVSKDERGEYFNAAWRYIDGNEDETVLVAGYGGKVFDIDSENRNVDGAAFAAEIEIPETDLRWVNNGLQGRSKRFDYIELSIIPTGDFDMTATFIIDGKDQITRTINLADGSAAFDSAVFDTDVFGGTRVIKKRVPINAWGETIAINLANSGLNENFQLINLRLYFKPTGQLYESA